MTETRTPPNEGTSRRTRGSNAVVAVVDFYSAELRGAEQTIANQQTAIEMMAAQLREMQTKLGEEVAKRDRLEQRLAKRKVLPRGASVVLKESKVWATAIGSRKEALTPYEASLHFAVRNLGPDPKPRKSGSK